MPSHHDSAGRPIVVVTGMGMVTSLGAGKDDNWKKLTAGQSGIKAISRFATEGLKTRFAGTVDFVQADPLTAPELSERLADLAAEEAVAESAIGRRGDFNFGNDGAAGGSDLHGLCHCLRPLSFDSTCFFRLSRFTVQKRRYWSSQRSRLRSGSGLSR